MSKLEIVEGVDAHVLLMIGRLRQADQDELKALKGGNPISALIESWMTPGDRWAAKLDNRVIALFGVAPVESDPDLGIPWLLGTDDMERIKKSIVAKGREFTRDWLKKYKKLVNFVDARNTSSICWLKRCGFTFMEATPYGFEGRPFHMAILER